MSERIPGQARRFGELAQLPLQALSAGRNLLINGDFVVDQRRGDDTAYTSATTPANSDDTFLLDRWILLSDGNDTVDVNREAVGTSSDIPADGRGAIKLDVETANRKFGIFQPIENKNCKHIDGQVVSASFKVKAGGGSTISNVRIGIVQRSTGSEDSITSDIVSAWEAAGTDPTLIANWTYANTPANLALTTSYQTFKVESVTMSGLGNAGIFIWVDDTDAIVGEFVFIADVQLETGGTATDFQRRSISEEEQLCRRYFVKTFDRTVIPAQNLNDFDGALTTMGGSSVGNFTFDWPHRPSMRVEPTVTTFNTNAANGDARNSTDSTDEPVGVTNGDTMTRISSTAADSSHVGDFIHVHATGDSEL